MNPTAQMHLLAVVILLLAAGMPVCAAVLRNPDFETGDLSGWDVQAGPLAVASSTNDTYNRNMAARISGTYSGAGWITNGLSQKIPMAAGDSVRAIGFVRWDAAAYASPLGEGFVEARLEGPPGVAATQVWSVVHDGWKGFDLQGQYPGAANSGFEAGRIEPWVVGADDLTATLSRDVRYRGDYALRMEGSWTGWSWNQAFQVFSLQSGDVVHARARIRAANLLKTDAAGWAVAGIKLEQDGGPDSWEDVLSADVTDSGWVELSFSATINHTADYVFRCMICGDGAAGDVEADVYFDDVRFWKEVDGSGEIEDVTVSVRYIGTAGEEGADAAVSLYVDTVNLSGSTAWPETLDDLHADLLANAQETVTENLGLPPLVYPKLYAYGYPGGDTNVVKYPAHVEVAVAGWRFRALTNNAVLMLTNTLSVFELGGSGPGWIEIDQYRYVARTWNTARGEPLDIRTNAPYWTLGERDGSSTEFGDGPFPAEHVYTVGDPLSQFPRRLATHYDGVWPTRLHVVFPENLGGFDRTMDKHFVMTAVTTNGAADNIKALKIGLATDDPGTTNFVFESFEIHMGWAPEEESFGMVDYPNVTYQGHNEVFLRAGYLYGLVDREGWFAQPVARGSATIEPIALYGRGDGNWNWNAYEEYLYAWPNAGSGVRSLFDPDETGRLPGPASYHVGLKIGHQYGTNRFGEANFPGLIEIRGNGYFRMTDYDGVMGGSLRPVSADIFGIHQYVEDSPLMPEGYLALMGRTTPEGGPDDSFMRIFLPVRSKANEWFTGVVKTDAFFAPEQVADEGAYIEMETDLIANKALVLEEHGPLNVFAQVNMFWRGGAGINAGFEGHDHDTIKIRKSDGEWITHRSVNPPTNLQRRTLGALRSNDAVYILQQDRGAGSYGFATEAPYRRVSNFEFTILDDGGRDLQLDVFEQNTVSEINDNVVVACALNESLARGEQVHTRVRYRSTYAPGVIIQQPATADGGDNWGANAYRIEVEATDGHDEPLEVSLFYGNGRADGWIPIPQATNLAVPTNTHRVAHDWDVSAVPPGAYYIRAEAQRAAGGKTGFDVSVARLQVGPSRGLPDNGWSVLDVTTNLGPSVGTNLGFETGDLLGWVVGADHLDVHATDQLALEGDWSARMHGTWSGWSWNNLHQEIACSAGDILRVQGRVRMQALNPGGVDWLACGVKMESTNGADYSSAEQEFDVDIHGTGTWLNVDFTRVAPVNGTDRLLLWVAGNDGADVDVFFDDFHVTIGSEAVTSLVEYVHWSTNAPVDVSGHDVLRFNVAMAEGGDTLRVWAADADGVTNSVALTSVVERVVSLAQVVSVPWSAFPGIDRTRLVRVGFTADASGPPQVTAMRSTVEPVASRVRFVDPPLADAEGLPHYNPGEDVVQEITIENRTASALTGVNVQVVQEYGETTWWLDRSPHVAEHWSERNHKGDRLGGDFEQIWTNLTIPASGSVVLTNIYRMPEGRLIDHTRFAIPSTEDWFIGRNLDARAQVRLVIRTADGDNVLEHDQVGSYSMDNDFDMDNDALPDAWEIEFSGSPTGLHPDSDDDEDGFTNREELWAGTDPTDPLSFFALTCGYDPSGPVLKWFGMTGRIYTLHYSTNLLDAVPWQPLPGGLGIPGEGEWIQILDPGMNTGFRAYSLLLEW